jgi:hypothetical protein
MLVDVEVCYTIPIVEREDVVSALYFGIPFYFYGMTGILSSVRFVHS